MGKVYDDIDDALRNFIEQQKMFFVATSPSGTDGHINVSPKGLDSFRIIDPLTVAYLDLTGSGAETLAHLKANGRITLMFCAFEGAPKILRLYGKGRAIMPNESEFTKLAERFPKLPGTRSIIEIKCDRISDACGFAVPRMTFIEERTQLIAWAEQKGEQGLAQYRQEKNRLSIDGLEACPADGQREQLSSILLPMRALMHWHKLMNRLFDQEFSPGSANN